jgi:hypothetical protein
VLLSCARFADWLGEREVDEVVMESTSRAE